MINNVNKFVECNLLARCKCASGSHSISPPHARAKGRQEMIANAACNLMGRLAYNLQLTRLRRMQRHSRNRSEILLFFGMYKSGLTQLIRWKLRTGIPRRGLRSCEQRSSLLQGQPFCQRFVTAFKGPLAYADEWGCNGSPVMSVR
jgi:hypothetical protein